MEPQAFTRRQTLSFFAFIFTTILSKTDPEQIVTPMREQTVIVIGAGLAGVACALALKEAHPKVRVRLAEMSEACLPGFRRMAPLAMPSSESLASGIDDAVLESVYRGKEFARHLFHRFDRDAYRQTLLAWGGNAEGCVEPARTAEYLTAALGAHGVECTPGRKAAQVTVPGSDGLFRVWFDVGNPWEGAFLVLAMGGTWHRGFGWVEEWGHRFRRGSPAFLALRLTESRWRALTHVSWPDVTVSWQNPDTGERIEAAGTVVWRYPFLEGSAIAALTAQAGEALRSAGIAGTLEIILPDLKRRGLDVASLQQQVQQSGGRPVAESAPPDFHPAAWGAIVKGARIAQDATWSQLNRRQIQTLASRLSRLSVKFSGSRQWRDEFSIQGGLDLDQFVPGTLQSRCVEGLYVVGEMLDLDGAPGGTNLHLTLAGAAVAATGIGNALSA